MRRSAETAARPDDAARLPEVRVCLFGHVSVEVDGSPFQLATPRKTLPLLAYLLLNRGRALGRDFLSYLLWPDEPEEAARTKLRSNLYDLQRILPQAPAGHWVTIDSDAVRWRAEAAIVLDVEDFESAAADSQRLEAAIALYTGELLEPLYDEWVFPLRERYRNIYLATLAQLVSEMRRKLDFAKGISFAQRLLAADPWREDILRRLMTLRYESGDRTGALGEFHRFAQYVRTELGIDPMPETVSLRDAIARDAAADPEPLDASEPALVQGPDRQLALQFVGRRQEMDVLLDAWSRASRGRGSAVLIGGTPGIGKTRLAREFAREVEERGSRVLVGATGFPEAIPYQCLVDALRSAMPLVASLRLGGLAFATLATILPELQERVGDLPPLPRLETLQERSRLFEALARAITAVASPRPLLLILEDLHWAEEATVAALEFLVRRVALAKVLIVGTYRDDEVPRRHPLYRFRRDCDSEGLARSISLRPLSVADVEVLSGSLSRLDSRPAEKWHADSHGNPLFLTQLIEDAREGVFVEEPRGLRQLVSSRVERLTPRARAIAEVAALVGQRFSRDVVREVGGWEGGDVADALDELFERRIVHQVFGRGFFNYEFAHQIVCEVVADNAPDEFVHERHRRIARVLQDLYPERATELAAEVARHYDLAGDATDAVRSYLTAVRYLISLGALDEAEALLERAVPLDVGARLRADLLLERDAIARRRGDGGIRKATLGRLDALAAAFDDDDLRHTILLRQADLALTDGDRAEREDAFRALQVRAIGKGGSRLGALRAAESFLAFVLGNFRPAQESAEAALQAYREAGDEAGIAEALLRLVDVATQRGNLSEANALLEEALRKAERAGDATLELGAYATALMLAYSHRDFERCLPLTKRWLDRSLALGDRKSEAAARCRLGIILCAMGEHYATARELFSEAARVYAEIGEQSGSAGVLLNNAVLDARLGSFREARSATERAIAIFQRVKNERGEAIGFGNLSVIQVLAGDPEGARASALQSREISCRVGLGLIEASALENLAVAEAALGNISLAIELGEAGMTARARSESESWTGKPLADLGLWYARSGNLDAAVERIVRMLALRESLVPDSEWPQQCFWAAAQVFRAAGKPAEARRELGRACAVIEQTLGQLEGADRERFLAIPWHSDIFAARDNDVWPNPPR